MPLPVIVQGLGPIGRRILEGAAKDPRLQLVGAVDIHPSLAGRPLTEVSPISPPDLEVRRALSDVHAPEGAVVLQAIGSWLPDVAPQLESALHEGYDVVSTCEEMVWPWERHPSLAKHLHGVALAGRRRLVGTGVNPGFLMDQLPVFLTAATHEVRSVAVERVIDPRARRLQFQQKMGLETSLEEFHRRQATGRFGHVGLRESGQLLAAGLGWEITDWDERIEPVQPDPRGPVLGLIHTLRGEDRETRSIDLRLVAHTGITQSYDLIRVDGTPPLRLRFEGGVFGDDATAAAVLRTARVLPSARLGFITVLDLPLRHWKAPSALNGNNGPT